MGVNLTKKLVGNYSIGQLLLKLRTFIALIAISVFFGIMSPEFFSLHNIVIMSKHVAINAFLAIGMTFVIITGGIDLSVGGIVGLCGMIAGGLINEGLVLPMFGVAVYFHVLVIIFLTLLCGTLIGALNGVLITRFRLAPFICTLGVMWIARGFAMLRSGGETFSHLVGDPKLGNTGFPILGAGTIIGIPISIWLMVITVLITIYVSKKTPLGRHIYAVGGNEKAAALSGVQVNKVKLIVYMFSGFMSALAGLIIASQLVAS
ncbi:MAG: ABC transporter permease, partial [Chitinispirillia bacterium]